MSRLTGPEIHALVRNPQPDQRCTTASCVHSKTTSPVSVLGVRPAPRGRSPFDPFASLRPMTGRSPGHRRRLPRGDRRLLPVGPRLFRRLWGAPGDAFPSGAGHRLSKEDRVGDTAVRECPRGACQPQSVRKSKTRHGPSAPDTEACLANDQARLTSVNSWVSQMLCDSTRERGTSPPRATGQGHIHDRRCGFVIVAPL